jgi:hypothetical protein
VSVRTTSAMLATLIALLAAPASADDGSDALLLIPRTLVRLQLPDLVFDDGPITRGSLVLRAPSAHEEMCAVALEAYGATLDHIQPSCQTAGMLGVFEVGFLRKVIHPLLIGAMVLDGRMPGAGPGGDAAPAEPAEPFTLDDPTSGVRLRPSIVGSHGATLRATLRF